jgi:hypothetical protein
MFLKVQYAGTTASNAYYLFPDGTTNIVISVHGGDGGDGRNGLDGADGTPSAVNGKAGGNGGNAGQGGRSGRVKFFYSASSSEWLKDFIFYTNAGACGFPGYAGMGGLGYRTTTSSVANGRIGANGYNGRPCSEPTPDGPTPFFMQYDPASVLTDEIAAGLPLK